VVTPGAEPFWEAFWVLSGARQIGIGMGGVIEQPIAYSEIAAYARDQGFHTPRFWPGFLGLIQALDRVYRSAMATKRAAETPPTPPSGGKGRRA
jgi:hypothetical protein